MPYKSLAEEIPLPERKLRWRRGIVFDADPADAAPLIADGKAVEITREEATELLTEGAPPAPPEPPARAARRKTTEGEGL